MDAPIENKEIVGKEMECIRDTLENTEHSGLSVEVVWSAIRYAKNNPDSGVCEIMDAAIDEWDLE